MFVELIQNQTMNGTEIKCLILPKIRYYKAHLRIPLTIAQMSVLEKNMNSKNTDFLQKFFDIKNQFFRAEPFF